MVGYDYEVDMTYTIVEDVHHRATAEVQYAYNNLEDSLKRMMCLMKKCEDITEEDDAADFHVTLWQCGDNYKVLAEFASDDGYLWS